MTAAAKRRDHPLSMRLPEADNAVIDREASLLSRSRTEFVREAAVRAAEAVLMEQALVRMRADEWAAVIAPAEPVRLPAHALRCCIAGAELIGRRAVVVWRCVPSKTRRADFGRDMDS